MAMSEVEQEKFGKLLEGMKNIKLQSVPETNAMEEMVRRSLFDEAMRMGTQTATQAQNQLKINTTLSEAIIDAIGMLERGRAHDARARLIRAVRDSSKILK